MNPEPQPAHGAGDTFELYDLAVIVESIEGNCTCAMKIGDCFYVRSGKILLPDGADFCLYALQSTLPLLPAKQRKNHPADWLETDSRVACPDPACKLIMRIDRVSTRLLRHDDVSATPWAEQNIFQAQGDSQGEDVEQQADEEPKEDQGHLEEN